MALDPGIVPLLSGIVAEAPVSGAGRRQIAGETVAERLQFIVGLVSDTVLPRSYAFLRDDDTVCNATFASGRIVKLTKNGVATSTEAASRASQLVGIAQVFVDFVRPGSCLTFATGYTVGNLAAEDVGQTALELQGYFSDRHWFADQPETELTDVGSFLERAVRLTTTQIVLGPDGHISEVSGDAAEGLSDETCAHLMQEFAEWEPDLAALSGVPCMITLRGHEGQPSLSVSGSPRDAVVSLCDDHRVAALTACWRQSHKEKGVEE